MEDEAHLIGCHEHSGEAVIISELFVVKLFNSTAPKLILYIAI